MPRIEWNDDNVSTLKKLHKKGYSAGGIAIALGVPDGRLAVCGKLWRLGLSASRVANHKQSLALKEQRKAGKKAVKEEKPVYEDLSYTPRSVDRRPKKDKRYGATPATSVSAARDRAIAGTPVLKGDSRVLNSPVFWLEGGQYLTLLQLNEHTCKWPLGDPLLPGFGFCGAHSLEGKPYCAHHHRISTVRMETTK